MENQTLTEKVAAMDSEKFEKWMRRNGYTGMAAVKLALNRRNFLKTQADKPKATE